MSFVARGAGRLLDTASIGQGTVTYLEQALGLRQTGYRDWITMRAPKARETAFSGFLRTAASPSSRFSGPRSMTRAHRCG